MVDEALLGDGDGSDCGKNPPASAVLSSIWNFILAHVSHSIHCLMKGEVGNEVVAMKAYITCR